jgi:hypothetical protein
VSFGALLMLMLGVSLVAVGWATQARANRRALLSRAMEHVDGRYGEALSPFHDTVLGRSGDRFLELTISSRPWSFVGKRDTYPLTAAFDLQHAPDLELRIRRDRGLAAFEKAAGLVRDVEVAGGRKFDQDYLVEANEAPAEGPLADQEVRAAVDRLLVNWDLDEIRIGNGRLVAAGDSKRLGQALLRGILVDMEVLAHAYDRRRAVAVGLTERFYWVGGCDAAPRCPFCHDTLDVGENVSSCGGCKTMIHADCFEENRGCPILGCGARGAEPVGPIKV